MDLRKALAAAPLAQARWQDITPMAPRLGFLDKLSEATGNAQASDRESVRHACLRKATIVLFSRYKLAYERKRRIMRNVASVDELTKSLSAEIKKVENRHGLQKQGVNIWVARKAFSRQLKLQMDSRLVIFGDHMFRVDVDNLQSYFDFDPKRRIDLQKLDKLVRESAPRLKRYFHRGTPSGEPGMRFKMIGYGRFHYRARSGKNVEWPVVGVALQKNYVSVYLSVAKDGVPLVQSYSGKLGEIRSGRNNFSFEKYEDLVTPVVSSLFAEAERIFGASLDDRALRVIAQRRRSHKE